MKTVRKKVMVVDDEPDTADIIRLVLEAEGYEVTTAASGIEALEKIKDEVPHIIMTDISMPDMNGWEFIKKARESLNSIPFIVVTGRKESTDRIMGKDILKINDYIYKPFGRKELVNSVRSVLQVI